VSRSHRFLGGLVLTYGYQAILVLVGLWLTPFYLRNLGQHDYGLWLVGTQLLIYLTLTDFGVVALLPLDIAYATGRTGAQRSEDLHRIVGRTTRLVLYQVPLVAAVVAVMWMTMPAEWQYLRGPLHVVLLGFVLAFPLRLPPALLQGLQDLSFVNAMQILGWTITTAATVGMILAGWKLYALAVGWVMSQILLTPVFLWRLATRFPGVLPRHLPRLSWSATGTHLAKGGWVSVAQIARLLMSNVDLLIIGEVLGPAAVVPYSCTGKLAGVIANQAQLLMQTATPGLCELRSSESRDRLLQVLVALNSGILTFSGLVFCLVLLVNKWFVTWWVTAHQYGGYLLTAAILVNMLFRHWNTTAAYSVFCFGYQRRISLTNLADGLVTVAATLGLTIALGPVGAAFGSLAGVCLVSLPCNLQVIARDTGTTLPVLIATMLRSWLWRFLLMLGITLWLSTNWSPSNPLQACATAVCAAVLYLVVMLPNILRPPLGNYIRPLLTSFRGRSAALQTRFSE
jgi:O-antigen/teichoic acid export membrane protein